VHTCVQALENDIRDWIASWNDNPRPFTWTKTADEILNSLAGYLAKVGTGQPGTSKINQWYFRRDTVAEPLGVRPSSQLAWCAACRAGRRLSGNVADSACLIGSRVRRGTPEPTFRLAGSLLCLVPGWPLLKRPHVAVGVTEI